MSRADIAALAEQYRPPANATAADQAKYTQYVYLLENWLDNGGRRFVDGVFQYTETPPPPPTYSNQAQVYNPLYAAITGGNWSGKTYQPGEYTISAGTAAADYNPPPQYGTGTEAAPAGYRPPAPTQPAQTQTTAPAAGNQPAAGAQIPPQQGQTTMPEPNGLTQKLQAPAAEMIPDSLEQYIPAFIRTAPVWMVAAAAAAAWFFIGGKGRR